MAEKCMEWVSTTDRQPKTGGRYIVMARKRLYAVRFFDCARQQWRDVNSFYYYRPEDTTHFAINVPRAK